mgnify:FL=1|jgi:3-dehydroquinate dehydratase-1
MREVQVNNLIFGEHGTKICVPISGNDDKQILDDIEKLYNFDFDLIELRIDCYEYVENFSRVKLLLENIRKIYSKTILFTFRSKNEGGMHELSEEKYFELCNYIIASKLVDLIDVELSKPEESIKKIITFAREKGVRVIMSSHDFIKTPSGDEIVSRLEKMQDYDADITKIAVMANCEEDVLTLLSAALLMKKERADRPFTALSMGSMGIVTRLSGELFGSCLTFASLDRPSAPGQINVRNAREILNMLCV